MEQAEMAEFFEWCNENLKGFEACDAEESKHFYLNDEMIGGYAGDRQEFFYKQNDELATALRMFDASNTQDIHQAPRRRPRM